ncbi:outer membrane beta-barrel protein [Pseudophaeobacter sp.]|uniref:outer membrane beta-barrel protein n=1 Tax=Pseudophaeobacter sp. TaxID=1971739 RepID=UPI003296A3F6
MSNKSTGALALIIACLASAASAENYFGFSVEAMSAESKTGGSVANRTSDAVVPGISVILGRTYDAGNFFWGFEGSATINFQKAFENSGTPCSTSANGPYMCEQTAALRVYGVIGKEFDGFDLYGKLGYGAAFGDFATNTNTQDSGSIQGATVAIGAARDIEKLGKIFAEVIYDDFGSTSQPGGFDSDYASVGLRFGFVKPF